MTNKRINKKIEDLIDKVDTLINEITEVYDTVREKEEEYGNITSELDSTVEALEVERSSLAELPSLVEQAE